MPGVGIIPKMVKVTIKRTDNSPDSEKWICKSINDDLKLEPTMEKTQEPSESLPIDGQNINEESEDLDNWYSEIPSYLEIEMKEIESPQPSWGSLNDTNISEIKQSQGIADNPGNSCIDPMNLSTSYPKQDIRDVTNNVSNKSSFGENSSKSKFLENVSDDFRNTPGSTVPDQIIQGEDSTSLPKAAWSQNTPLTAKKKLKNSEEVVAMAMRTMPSTNQNFSMSIHRNSPSASGFLNLEKPEIMAKGKISNHLTQEALRPLETNNWQFGADDHQNTRDYGHSSITSYSDANRSYNSPLASENNPKILPIRSNYPERIGENLASNLPQNHTKNLKRLTQTCTQMGTNDTFEPFLPAKRKKSHTKVPDAPNHCNVCDTTFKTINGFNKHFQTEKHLKKANQAVPQQSNSYNFQPNTVSRPCPSALSIQPQPHPYFQYLMANQMQYHQMLQAQAMSAANHFVGGVGSIIKNTDGQKSNTGTSNSDCSNEFLDQNRSQNDLEIKCHGQDPRNLNFPVHQRSNPQDIFLPPKHLPTENSNVNSRHLEKKAPQGNLCHNNPSSQNQPANSRTWHSMGKPVPCGINPNQLENLTRVGSLQKPGFFQSVSPHQLEFFRVFHCLICSKFYTDDLRELERHISIIRNKTPFEMITVLNENLHCKLCDIQIQTSKEMVNHCNSIIHLNRVDFYNHVMEGGIHAREKLNNVHKFSSVFIFCAACDFLTESLDALRVHSNEPNHLHNALCCMYASMFSPAVDYCFCRLCRVKTSTKNELLLHVRSKEHMDLLQKYPSDCRTFHDLAHLLFIKELSSNIKEVPRVSEQIKGNLCNERERLHLREESNEMKLTEETENRAPLDLSSASSFSQKLLAVSCSLCQEVLPEINVLVQHLQRIHGVSEKGVKWLISTTTEVREEKSLPKEEPRNTEEGKIESIVFAPQRSATDKTLPTQGRNTDSSSYQSSIAARQNVKSKSPTYHKTVSSLQNLAIGENLNKEESMDTNFTESQQFYKREYMQNRNKLYKNTEERIGINFSSSQQLYEPECIQKTGTPSIDSSDSHQFSKIKGLRNSNEPLQNPDFDQERVNTGSPSSQLIHKTGNISPVEEEVFYTEENLNPSSSPAKVIVENESEPNGYSKYETQTDESSSEHFSTTEHGLLIQQSGLNARRKRNDSSSGDIYSPSKQQLCEVVIKPPLEEEEILNSEGKLNSISSQSDATIIVEYESELNRGKLETEAGVSSRENFSATDRGLTILSPYYNASRISNASSSRENDSVIHERMPSMDDSSLVDTIPISLQSDLNVNRGRSDSSPSEYNYPTPERLLEIYDSSIEHSTPISKSNLNQNSEWYDDFSSSDHNSETHEWSPLRDKTSSNEHETRMSPSRPNASREMKDFSRSDPNSVIHQQSLSTDDSATKNDLSNSQSDIKVTRNRNNSSSSDDIFIEYESLPVRAARSRGNSPPNQPLFDSESKRSLVKDKNSLNLRESVIKNSNTGRLTNLVTSIKNRVDSLSNQHYLLQSENRRSHLEENVVIDSNNDRSTALVESKKEADNNISVAKKSSDDSVNSPIILDDSPNDYERGVFAPNSPSEIHLQMQARKSIESIEILNVFSLANDIENSSDTEEEEENFNFEGIDLEEL